ncbi:RepA family replication protein [Agarivorans sp. B2Z047]|uniref:RepA family replication protein n=1 Tax=Agarivorans sp. B2Z047 TaxID=2652721 RepID=UPI0018837A35|nr:RepA family replication protein [Agarivorans sp. B2Z047]
MVLLGLIRFVREEQVFDGELGMWLDSYYEVTPLFFMALGFTTKRVVREQNKRLAFLKSNALEAGKSAEEVGRMTISHLKDLRRHEWRKRAFERRAKEKARAKFQRMLHEKKRNEQRSIASKRVLSFLSREQLASISSPAEFLDLVNREIALMRQVSGVPAPPQ